MKNTNEYNRINKSAVKCWIIGRSITLFILLAIIIGLLYRFAIPHTKETSFFRYLWIGLAALILILLVLNAFVYPFIEYKEWRFGIFQDKIELMSGIFIKDRTIIPISRIQSINIEQGPIYRRFKLASVKIHTAGGVHQIPALTNSEAEAISENLKNVIEAGGKNE
jgi:uncharacterized protein